MDSARQTKDTAGAGTNSAEMHSVRQAVDAQGALLGQHSQTLRDIMVGLRELSVNMTSLQSQFNQVTSTTPAPPPLLEPWVPAPERYDGDFGLCRSFLMQCDLVFEQ